MNQNSPSEMARLHITVSGRVQGVGFRAFVAQSAGYMNLTGWVRNVGYDQVEVMAEGARPVLEKFLNTVKTGPRPAHVDASHEEWLSATGEFDRFTVRSSR
jgi:acylphosphatase